MPLWMQLGSAAGCGLIVGFLSGVLGIGGGVFMVPFFLWIFQREGMSLDLASHVAVSTSLAIVCCQSFAGALTHQKNGFLDGKIIRTMAPLALMGIVLAGQLRKLIETQVFLYLFLIILMVTSIQLLFSKNSPPTENDPIDVNPLPGEKKSRSSSIALCGVGFGAGFVGALLGVGGGIILVPGLHMILKFSMRKAIVHSVGMMFFIGLFASFQNFYLGMNSSIEDSQTLYDLLGFIRYPWVLAAVLFSIPTAILGARMVQNLPLKLLKRIFGIFIFSVALYMFSLAMK